MNNIKFMPCPFCGKNPRILYQGRFCTIMHKNCAAGFDIVGTFDSEDKAIKAWNTRYERTCQNVHKSKDSGCFECSLCGCNALGHDWKSFHIELEWNHCPNCGAKVKED